MKKLLFAIAGAAAFAAMANDPAVGDNIDVLGFENFDLTNPNVTGAVINRDDTGVENPSKWSCSGDDASTVKAYGGENAAVPSVRAFPAPFDGAGDNYLALDTNGSELQRAIPAAGQTVAAEGTYIDTLVQFTPSESAPTAEDLNGAKLAIWLGVDQENNTTNLMVKAARFDNNWERTPYSFTLSGVVVKPETWYRLTVKAIVDITGSAGEEKPGFKIFIDGTPLSGDVGSVPASLIEEIEDSIEEDDVLADLNNNRVFASLVSGATAELTSVGFKGTGALDDFVVTTADPFPASAAIDFTLTWPAGLTAVSYTIDGGEPVAISGASPLSIPSLVGGEAITFIVQNADGAQKTLSATAANGEGIDATGTTFGWADYLGAAVDGAYEIDNLAELKLFQKGIAVTTNELKLATAGETFKLTADITLDAAWPGIGVQNGKDIWSTADFNAAAFQGTFDGQNHTISGFQMVGGNLDYCGFFNSTYGATIQNLKIQYAGSLFAVDSASSTEECGATFVGVAKESTLQNLTSLEGTVSCGKGFGGVAGFVTSGTTVEYCTNNVNVTSLAGNKAGGVVMITQGGSGTATIRNCVNNGTTTGNAKQKGGIIGYLGTDGSVVIENCINNADSEPTFFSFNKGTVTVNGVNKAPDSAVPCKNTSGAVIAVSGLKFATVDKGVATFVADNALAAGNAYKVMAPATATYEFATAGSISFDTNLIQAVTFAITAPGLDLTEATESGVVTFTAAAQGGDDYVVEIEGSDVTITPTDEDLAALAAAGVDTNSVTAVNEALATPIPGGDGVLAWQAAFLGVEPTTNGLKQVAIKSVSFDANGKVVVDMADAVNPKTGRGVDITLKLMASDDLAFTAPTVAATATAATGFEFEPVMPGSGDTKKFYKVVVEFAAPSQP